MEGLERSWMGTILAAFLSFYLIVYPIAIGILLVALDEEEIPQLIARNEWSCILSLAFMPIYGAASILLVFRPVSRWVRYTLAGIMTKGVLLSLALGLYNLIDKSSFYIHLVDNLVACGLLATGLIFGYQSVLARFLLPFRQVHSEGDDN